MLRFIRRLFDRDGAESESPRSSAAKLIVQSSSRRGKRRTSDAHFDNMARIQGSISRQAFGDAARFVRDSFRHIPDWVQETRHEYGLSISPRFRRCNRVERFSPLIHIS
jgi:hypothetical protein